jgi:hypothetical protein
MYIQCHCHRQETGGRLSLRNRIGKLPTCERIALTFAMLKGVPNISRRQLTANHGSFMASQELEFLEWGEVKYNALTHCASVARLYVERGLDNFRPDITY